jgi:hypothetical protein
MLTAANNGKAPVQGTLGGHEDRKAALARVVDLHEEANEKLASLGDRGINKPKDTLLFVKDLNYKALGNRAAFGCASPAPSVLVYNIGIKYNTGHLRYW